MPHLPARSGRSALALALALLASALGVAAVLWLQRSTPPEQTGLAPAERGASPAAPTETRLVPSAPEVQQAERAVAERGAQASNDPPIALDHDRPLRGRIVPDRPWPDRARPEVVLSVWRKSGEGPTVEQDLDWDDDGSVEVARVPSNASGIFELPRPVGVTKVRIWPEGDFIVGGDREYAVGSDEEPGEGRFDISAEIGAHVTLRLLFEDIASPSEIASLEGKPLTLWTTGESSDFEGESDLVFSVDASVGADGLVSLPALRAFDWWYSKSWSESGTEGLGPFLIERGCSFEPEVGERVVIDVPVRRGWRFEGRVTDWRGDPVQDASIDIRGRWGPHGERDTHAFERRSGADGRFMVEAVPDTLDVLWIHAEGYFGLELGPDELAPFSESNGPHEFTLERGAELVLRVTDSAGRPASHLPLMVRGATPETEGTSRRVTTDEDGVARLDTLPLGPLHVRAAGRLRMEDQREPEARMRLHAYSMRPRGILSYVDGSAESLWTLDATLSTDAAASGVPQELLISRAPPVRGRILGIDPSWAEPVRVAVFPAGQEDLVSSQLLSGSGGTFPVDPNTGAFEGQLPCGEYLAVAICGTRPKGRRVPGSPQVHRTPVAHFAVDSNGAEVSLAFEVPVMLSGNVKRTDGEPVAGLRLRLLRIERSAALVDVYFTDDAGAFQFVPQQPGTFTVAIDSSRLTLIEPDAITLEAGSTAPSLELVVEGAGALRALIRTPTGATRAAWGVAVFGRDGAPRHVDPIEDDSEWNGALGPLPPGPYRISVTQELDSGDFLLRRADAEVTEGRVTTLVFDEADEPVAEATGRLTSGGRPASDLMVRLDDDQGQVAWSWTDDEGRFRLHAMTPGSMTLRWGEDLPVTYGERQVELFPGINALEPIVLPTGAIEGQLEDHWGSNARPVLLRSNRQTDGKPFRYSGKTYGDDFEFEHLPDGDYVLTTCQRGGAPRPDAPRIEVQIRNGERARGVRLPSRAE